MDVPVAGRVVEVIPQIRITSGGAFPVRSPMHRNSDGKWKSPAEAGLFPCRMWITDGAAGAEEEGGSRILLVQGPVPHSVMEA